MSDNVQSSSVPVVEEKGKRPYVPQKPVFIVQPFDIKNVEHMRGNVTLTLNKRFAADLCALLRECELGKDEGYIFAMQANLQRWYNDRYSEIKKMKAENAAKEIEQPK